MAKLKPMRIQTFQQLGAIPPLEAACTNNVPTIGPVHEKETIAKANAMNKIPITPPLSA